VHNEFWGKCQGLREIGRGFKGGGCELTPKSCRTEAKNRRKKEEVSGARGKGGSEAGILLMGPPKGPKLGETNREG